MTKKAKIIADDLIAHYASLEKTRLKIEKVFDDGNIGKRDVEKIYDGLFVNVVGSFENFLEELFLGLLSNKLSVSFSLKTRVNFTSIQSARKVLLGNDKYLKWLPYDYTTNLADIYFLGKNPFNRLEASDKFNLSQIICIRNAVAHKSPYSIEKFEKNIISNTRLLRSEKNPSSFLRANFRTNPNQTRYENYVNLIAQIVVKISK